MSKYPILANHGVVFVSGYYNGAIYDFNHNKIYSVNHDANEFLLRIFNGGKAENVEEENYLSNLEQKNLYRRDFSFHKYKLESQCRNCLNFAWLEITQICNLRCLHCYEGEIHQSANDKLTFEEWKRVIKELSENGCPNIQFIGGEPSCCANIVDLIDYAGNRGFQSISFFTNATLITDTLISCFVRNKVKVNVSLYGHTKEMHDAITQTNGSFNKTVANIKKMKESGLQITVAVTVMRENESYFEDIEKFVKSLGVQYQKFDLIREVSNCHQNCHMVTRNDLIAKKYLIKPSFSISKVKFEKAITNNTCWYGKFAISENGNVLPCVFERNISYGNLRELSIRQLMDSAILNQYWHMDFSQIEECKDCEYRYACKDCRPLGRVNGGINKKNIRCMYHPLTGEWSNNGE